MSTTKTVERMDFFTNATRMTLKDLRVFLESVVLKMDPRRARPIIIWGAPGIAKTALVEQVFAKHPKGLRTVIASQLGALDVNGLPHITKDSLNVEMRDENGEVLRDEAGNVKFATVEVDTTEFTPTKHFARGMKNIFLDEFNNGSGSTLAALQNLLSAREQGGDSFQDVFILAACNPPSTNSLANDLNFPTISRCLNVIVDYTLQDFVDYAMMCGTIHPSIVAFHKKTSGQYLQANWECVKNHGYVVPEPNPNNPFPCPRSWEGASDYMNGMAAAGNIEYRFLQPIVEGWVGPQAASQFATTYAYMERLPDFDLVWKGAHTHSDYKNIRGEVSVEYMTAFTAINKGLSEIDRAKSTGMKCIMPKDKDAKRTDAWHLIAGIHRLIQFVTNSCSPELGTMTMSAIMERIRILPGSFLSAVYQDVDPDNGLTRKNTFQNVAFGNRDGLKTVTQGF